MKRFLIMLFCVTLSLAGVAQNTRTVKGMVFDQNDIPLSGAVVKSITTDQSVQTTVSGAFELQVATHVKQLKASKEGYIDAQLEVDGSYLIFKLKIDKKYAENKAKAEEAARIAAQQEAEAKAKAEEAARIAAEKEAAAKAKAEEAARIAAEKEAAAKAKAEEAARKAAEKEAAKAKAAEKTTTMTASAKSANSPTNTPKVKVNKEKPEWVGNYESGYFSMVNLNYIPDMRNDEGPHGSSYAYAGLTYVGGYQLNKRHYIGVGLGVEFDPLFEPVFLSYSDIDSWGGFSLPGNNVQFPIYAYYRFNFLQSRLSPFVGCALGGILAKPTMAEIFADANNHDTYHFYYSSSGVLFNPQLGVDFKMTPKSSVYFSIGCKMHNLNEYRGVSDYVSPTLIIESRFPAMSLDINLGFTF